MRPWIAFVVFVLFGIVFLLGFSLFYWVHAMNSLTLEGVRVSGITEVSLSGFTLSGSLDVLNPSMIDLIVDRGDYDLFLDYTNQSLGSGTILGGEILAGSTRTLTFSQQVLLKLDPTLALKLIALSKIYVRIDGTVLVEGRFTSPVQEKIDIKPMIVGELGKMKNLIGGLR